MKVLHKNGKTPIPITSKKKSLHQTGVFDFSVCVHFAVFCSCGLAIACTVGLAGDLPAAHIYTYMYCTCTFSERNIVFSLPLSLLCCHCFLKLLDYFCSGSFSLFLLPFLLLLYTCASNSYTLFYQLKRKASYNWFHMFSCVVVWERFVIAILQVIYCKVIYHSTSDCKSMMLKVSTERKISVDYCFRDVSFLDVAFSWPQLTTDKCSKSDTKPCLLQGAVWLCPDGSILSGGTVQ